MEKALIRAQDLCKSFISDGVQNHVLNHIDIKIKEGDFTVIMGSSGSGKSTLLYSLSGMDNITNGKVFYKDSDITQLKENDLMKLRSEDFGFVFQQMHLISNLTIFENIVVPGYLDKTNLQEDVNERGRKLAKKMGIEHILKRYPSQVSGGEQQRASVARALISNPSIIFADEPTGALNKQTGLEVLDLLTDINRDGHSILMVTHDPKATARANRVLYLEDGKIEGEISLPFYKETETKSREKQISNWLSNRGW